MFDVHMLPARHGDCLWVEYGSKDQPCRLLIDCGTGSTYAALKDRIEKLPKDQRVFELFVITHVDDDHIGGSLKLLDELTSLGVTFGDVWFNAFPHLEGRAIMSGADLLGARQGEKLSELIVDRALPWNRSFKGRAVVCEDGEDLPQVQLPGGMKITLLSPYWEQLARLKKAWIDECRKARLLPGEGVEGYIVDDTLGDDVDALAKLPFEPDSAPANGSSIAFIAEHGGVQVLFGADAFAPVLVKSLGVMGYSVDSPLRLAAMKVPHHGSSHNLNRELIEVAVAEKLLISTNGDKFQHPDRAAIARIVKFNHPDASIFFNYASIENEFWGNAVRQKKYRYTAVYPKEGDQGLSIRLADY